MKIVSLVERDGDKRSFHVPNVNAATLGPILKAQIAKTARLMTDEAKYYKKTGKHFASHETVNHARGEYARGDVTSNTVESSFAILKRGLIGTFHSVSEQHLQRYCVEFDFRWNTRMSQGYSDMDRANHGAQGHRWQAPDLSADSRASLRVSVIRRLRREHEAKADRGGLALPGRSRRPFRCVGATCSALGWHLLPVPSA